MNFNPLEQAPSAPLTPRQDRIEAAITQVLRNGGTRSTLRAAVDQYADLLRAQGVPREQAIARLETLARQATSLITLREPVSVGDSLTDRIGMIVRWCARRYHRAD